MQDKKENYPEGHFVGMWMIIGIAVFSGIGVPLSIITQNYGFLGIGPALGVAIGLSIGQGVENKYKRDGKIRPLTENEKKRKKMAVFAGFALLALGIIMFLIFLFFGP